MNGFQATTDESWHRSGRGQWAVAACLFAVALWPRIFFLDAMPNIDAVLYGSERIHWRC